MLPTPAPQHLDVPPRPLRWWLGWVLLATTTAAIGVVCWSTLRAVVDHIERAVLADAGDTVEVDCDGVSRWRVATSGTVTVRTSTGSSVEVFEWENDNVTESFTAGSDTFVATHSFNCPPAESVVVAVSEHQRFAVFPAFAEVGWGILRAVVVLGALTTLWAVALVAVISGHRRTPR